MFINYLRFYYKRSTWGFFCFSLALPGLSGWPFVTTTPSALSLSAISRDISRLMLGLCFSSRPNSVMSSSVTLSTVSTLLSKTKCICFLPDLRFNVSQISVEPPACATAFRYGIDGSSRLRSEGVGESSF